MYNSFLTIKISKNDIQIKEKIRNCEFKNLDNIFS